jgi:hypothetical protein
MKHSCCTQPNGLGTEIPWPSHNDVEHVVVFSRKDGDECEEWKPGEQLFVETGKRRLLLGDDPDLLHRPTSVLFYTHQLRIAIGYKWR